MRRSAANLFTVLALTAAVTYGFRSGWIPAPAKLAQLFEARLVLHRVDGPSSETMKLLLDDEGAVWVTTKYDVTRYPGGERRQAEVVLDGELYRSRFGRPTQALSWASFGNESGELWVGSWYGEVLRYKAREGWTLVVDRGSGPASKIVGLVDRDAELWIATSNGLWRRSLTEQSLERVDAGFRSSLVGLTIDAEGNLLLGSVEGVRRHEGGAWREVWSDLSGARNLTALGALENGGLWLGFYSQGGPGGLLELDREDREVRRFLDREWVTDLVELSDGRWLVATWQQGLFVESGDRFRKLGFSEGLPDDSLGTMVLDREERLWLGLYGEGVLVADLSKVEELALEADASRIADPHRLKGQVFENACEAAETLLGGTDSSGQIHRERQRSHDQQETQEALATGTPLELVFLERHLACPKGWIGYHRGEPGSWVATRLDRPDRLLGESPAGPTPTTLALPSELGSFQVTALFVDARGFVWLGTRDRGMWLLTTDGPLDVSDPELLNNPVSAIAEDAAGSIWVGTSPPASSEGERKAGLHLLRFEGDPAAVGSNEPRTDSSLPAEEPGSSGLLWQHFRAQRSRFVAGANRRRGLASDTVNDLLLLSDGWLAVGTNGGLTLIRGKAMKTFRSRDAGLRHHFIDAMTEDSDRRMWITHAFWGPGYTRKGAMLFKNQSSRHGLFEDPLFKAAFDAEGRTWLLGASGRVGVYPPEALQ